MPSNVLVLLTANTGSLGFSLDPTTSWSYWLDCAKCAVRVMLCTNCSQDHSRQLPRAWDGVGDNLQAREMVANCTKPRGHSLIFTILRNVSLITEFHKLEYLLNKFFLNRNRKIINKIFKHKKMLFYQLLIKHLVHEQDGYNQEQSQESKFLSFFFLFWVRADL